MASDDEISLDEFEMDEEIIQSFITETVEIVNNVEEDILAIEETTDPEIMNRIMRAFHTLKGNSLMLGYENLGELAHKSEDVLISVREGKIVVSKSLIDIIFESLDVIKILLEKVKTNDVANYDLRDIISKLIKFSQIESDELKPEMSPEIIPKAIKKVPNKKRDENNLRMLVVEDDFVSRSLITTILSEFGQVDVAINGQEAIDAFERIFTLETSPYDLICMDIMMPEVNGMEALRKIRQIEMAHKITPKNEVAVFMVTALNDPKTVIRSLYKCGATSYLIKPIRKEKLYNEIKKLYL